jgi:SAM-dependent methyltransferase
MEPHEYEAMDAVEEQMWWYRALHGRLLEALGDVHGTILDAGCGTGGFLARLRRDRPDLTAVGVEVHASAAERAASKSGQSVYRASVEDMPFEDNTFDAIVCADVLCHRSLTPLKALKELGRVLRPGGRLILNLPAHEWLRSTHDSRVHTATRSSASSVRRQLVQCGFTDLHVAYWNALLLPLMVAQRKLLGRRAESGSDVKPFHPVANAVLFGVTEIERGLPRWFPAGGSVMATAHRPRPSTLGPVGGAP